MNAKPTSLRRLAALLCAWLLAGAALWGLPSRAQNDQTGAGAALATFANAAPLAVSDADGGGAGTGSLYPSVINVAGLSGTVTDVNLTLSGLTHTWPDDLALLLVGPGGQSLVLQSDAGGDADVSNLTYTLDDDAASGLPNAGPLTGGSYRPTSVDAGDDQFPASAGAPSYPYTQPAPAGTSTLDGTFGGTTPNGVWRLYVVDNFSGDAGAINGGWTPTVTTDAAATANPIDAAQFFVRQHYQDFLGREPDAAGLQFWTSEITSCGADAACVEARRVNVSAAFFLSIEFQETGYLVYRMHKAAYGDIAGKPVPLTREEFVADAQLVGEGVEVGVGAWQQRLEANKNAYAAAFVARPRFDAAHPASQTAAQFVDALDANAGGALSAAERDALVAALNGGAMTRAQVLRAVAEDETLKSAEFNRAFVLTQYFGYLRRNPDAAPDANFDGYNFWLQKLDQFDGDYVSGEMVRAFILSIEYRQRFVQ